MTSDALDAESARWVTALTAGGREGDEALARLRELLLRAARSELNRRAPRYGIRGVDLDDLADQVADDATLLVVAKIDTFRGESRFTTWAYKFAIFEVSGTLGRHVARRADVSLDEAQWDALPQRLVPAPADAAVGSHLVAAVRHAVDTELTEWQRTVFVAVVVEALPLDAVVVRFGSNRNAIYKAVFDARRKIRAHLDANGWTNVDGRPS